RAALRAPGRRRRDPGGHGARDRARDLLGGRRRPTARGQFPDHGGRAREALPLPGRSRRLLNERAAAAARRPPASPYGCVPQSMNRGLSGPVVRRVIARVARSMTARLYLAPSSSRKTTCLPSGENEPAKAFFDPPVNSVS